MKKVIIDEQVLLSWIREFYEEHGTPPGLRDLYRHKGCPYNKNSILKEYENLSNLLNKANLGRKRVGYSDITDEELLAELKDAVLCHKTSDRDKLRICGVKDRSVYENRFGSWSNALKLAGVDNSFKTLIRYFPQYRGEDYIDFLKKVIGTDGEFTVEQEEIMEKAKELSYDPNQIRSRVSYKKLKRNFGYVSILLIACGIEPTVNYCSGNKYIANDGHKCDSSKEVVIDDFLSENGIEHEVHVSYPNSKTKCDFKVGDTWIEYAGLTDKANYKKDLDNKIKFAKINNLKQIVLYDTAINTLNKLKAALTSDC